MPAYFVIYFNPATQPSGRWESVIGPNSDQTFTANNGEDAMGQASIQTKLQGKFAAFNISQAPFAYFMTELGNPNANLVLTAKVSGVAGTGIRFRIVVAGNNTAQSVFVTGNDITLNAATNSSGNPTTTGSQAVTAVNGNGAASALVTAALAPGSDGTGAVSTLDYVTLDQYGAEAANVTLMTVSDEAATTF